MAKVHIRDNGSQKQEVMQRKLKSVIYLIFLIASEYHREIYCPWGA